MLWPTMYVRLGMQLKWRQTQSQVVDVLIVVIDVRVHSAGKSVTALVGEDHVPASPCSQLRDRVVALSVFAYAVHEHERTLHAGDGGSVVASVQLVVVVG